MTPTFPAYCHRTSYAFSKFSLFRFIKQRFRPSKCDLFVDGFHLVLIVLIKLDTQTCVKTQCIFFCYLLPNVMTNKVMVHNFTFRKVFMKSSSRWFWPSFPAVVKKLLSNF